jgi:hypothetical protein
MIVCAPDMTVEIVEKFGVQPCQLITLSIKLPLRRGIDVLADVGLRAAKEGVDVWRYVGLIAKVRPTWAICPDVFGDYYKTLAMWRMWSPLLSRFTHPIFVFQEFYRLNISAHTDFSRLHEFYRRAAYIDRVAIPMRRHHDVNCALRPRLCAERAERALRWLCGYVPHVHLLGPPLRAVRLLRGVLNQCERQGSVVSFDTSAYRRAPNSALKRRFGGRWQPRNAEEAAVMLEAWLRQALT